MNKNHDLMKFDPATGEERPYPSQAAQYRAYYGLRAWLINPWTGKKRNAADIGGDTFGVMLEASGGQLFTDSFAHVGGTSGGGLDHAIHVVREQRRPVATPDKSEESPNQRGALLSLVYRIFGQMPSKQDALPLLETLHRCISGVTTTGAKDYRDKEAALDQLTRYATAIREDRG